MSAHAQAPQ